MCTTYICGILRLRNCHTQQCHWRWSAMIVRCWVRRIAPRCVAVIMHAALLVAAVFKYMTPLSAVDSLSECGATTNRPIVIVAPGQLLRGPHPLQYITAKLRCDHICTTCRVLLNNVALATYSSATMRPIERGTYYMGVALPRAVSATAHTCLHVGSA
jgi:hypothetical protein